MTYDLTLSEGFDVVLAMARRDYNLTPDTKTYSELKAMRLAGLEIITAYWLLNIKEK